MVLTLAIESSCDEFSMALVADNKKCIAMETLSQIDIHAKYGGVIPELASREHAKLFPIVMEKIGEMLEGNWQAIDNIAVTVGPGLSGSLLIGIQVAKTLATILKKPLIPIHHILGHVFSVALTQDIQFPLLSLVASGGHTELILSTSLVNHTVIGSTRDDAVGEVYDKLARKLNLPYPGGPVVDKLSKEGSPTYQFTKPKMDEQLAFSFSGLKSAVINEINRANMKKETINVPDICASFQKTVVEELIGKLTLAIQLHQPKTITLCGGVSANSALRKAFLALSEMYPKGYFVIPELQYCGDNAAMIGAASSTMRAITQEDVLKLECYPNLTLEQYYRKFL